MEAIVQARAATVAFSEVRENLRLIRDLPVTNAEEQEDAALGIRYAKEQYEVVEAFRRRLTDPLNKVVKDINNLFRADRELCLDVERVVKARLAGYVEQKRLENDRAVAEAASAATSEQAELALSLVKTVEMPAGTSMRYQWVATITDESLLPREYLTPSMDKILRAVRDSDGRVQIPGVSMYQEPIVSSRRV